MVKQHLASLWSHKDSELSAIKNCKWTLKIKKHLKRCKNVPKGERKWTIQDELSIFGRGTRIRTLNDGVRVRSVTVTLCLYIRFSQLRMILYIILKILSSVFSQKHSLKRMKYLYIFYRWFFFALNGVCVTI